MSTSSWPFLGAICAVSLLTGVSNAAPVSWSQWQNSLKPKGQPAQEITLAQDGRTNYAIVIPAAPTPQDRKAAEELARWLGEMTGATFATVPDTQAPRAREISVGHTSRVAQAKPAITTPDLGDEGYSIAVRGERLFLLGGRKRGAINAALALLEEDLGCRWYTTTDARIPKRPTVVFSPVPRSYAPPLEIRDPFYSNAFNGDWSLMNRTNAPGAAVPEELGGHIGYALFVHTSNTLVSPDKYFAQHPEYYMMSQDGKRTPQQLCFSNPDVVRIATENCLQILKDKPNCEIISVSKNDGGGSCNCPKCRAINKAEGSDSGSLLNFVNQVAANIEKVYPRVQVSTLAYLETYQPPKTIRPRRNVAIQLCTDRCMWAYPFTPARLNKDFSSALVAWSKVTDRIHIWDYCVNFSHYTAPMPNMDVVADNIRFFVDHHCRGVMEQGAYQSPGSEFEWMRVWVMAKLMWDPSRDLQELMQDFIYGYYGKAAPAIAEYNTLLYKTGAEHRANLDKPEGGIRYPMDSPFLSPEFLARATALFAQAEKLADNEEILHRVQDAGLPIVYVKLCRGPQFCGKDYSALLDRFETVAKRVGLAYIAEGPPDVERKLKEWREAARVHSALQDVKAAEVKVWPLPNEWRFAPDPKDTGVAERWFASDFDDSRWAKVRSDKGYGWEKQGFADYLAYGWYRQEVAVPANVAGRHLYLHFGAVDEDAYIYINGKLAFEHSCNSTGLPPEVIWQTPFSFDAAPFVQPGKTNVIAVRVYNRLGDGGVWKPTYLVAAEKELFPALVTALVDQHKQG
jgi:hypothetical protein